MPMLVRRTLSIDSFFVRVRARLRLHLQGRPCWKIAPLQLCILSRRWLNLKRMGLTSGEVIARMTAGEYA
jgi:hypothetical protein